MHKVNPSQPRMLSGLLYHRLTKSAAAKFNRIAQTVNVSALIIYLTLFQALDRTT